MREKNCVIIRCFNWHTAISTLPFYGFPVNAERQKQWIFACGLTKATKHTVICAWLHFMEEFFKANPSPGSKRQLRLTAIPNKSLPPNVNDENAGCTPKKRRVLVDILPPGQIPEPPHSVAMEAMK